MDSETLATEVRACADHYKRTHDRAPTVKELWHWIDEHSPISRAANPEGTLPFD